MVKHKVNHMDVIQLFETRKLNCPIEKRTILDFVMSHINAVPICNTISLIFILILSFHLRLVLYMFRSMQLNTKRFNNICWRLDGFIKPKSCDADGPNCVRAGTGLQMAVQSGCPWTWAGINSGPNN